MTDPTMPSAIVDAGEEFFESHHDAYMDWLFIMTHNDVVTLSDSAS